MVVKLERDVPGSPGYWNIFIADADAFTARLIRNNYFLTYILVSVACKE